MDLLYSETTSRILEVFYDVHRELGHGFLESIYSGAMQVALLESGLTAEREPAVDVFFRNNKIGTFRADLVVERLVLVEIKASQNLPPTTEAQVFNYLRATQLEVALVLHFGHKPRFMRRILTNDRKRAVAV